MSQNIIQNKGTVPNPAMGPIYQCSGNYTAEISSITITNDSDDYIIEVRKVTGGTTEGVLLFRFDLDNGDVHTHTKKINLIQGDKIIASSNKNTTEFIIEGIETSTTP